MSAASLATNVAVIYGPTRAWIDSVRYIANVSSGRLGVRIIEALLERGAYIDAIVGPGAEPPPASPNVRFHPFETLDDLRRIAGTQLRERHPDIVIMAAAVLDYVPAESLHFKRNADGEPWHLVLKPTPKLIDEFRAIVPDALLVGFKLESESDLLFERAHALLDRSGADLIVANLMGETSDEEHRAWLVGKGGILCETERGKAAVAGALIGTLERQLAGREKAT